MPRLSAVATAAGADTYAQAEVLTQLIAGSQQGYRVLRYGYEISAPSTAIFPSNVVAAQKLEMAWSPKSAVAMQQGWVDEVAAKKVWACNVAALSLPQVPFPSFAEFDVEDPDPFIIIEDKFYFSHKSTGTTFTYSVGMWIDVELVKVSDSQRIQILTSRLT